MLLGLPPLSGLFLCTHDKCLRVQLQITSKLGVLSFKFHFFWMCSSRWGWTKKYYLENGQPDFYN